MFDWSDLLEGPATRFTLTLLVMVIAHKILLLLVIIITFAQCRVWMGGGDKV